MDLVIEPLYLSVPPQSGPSFASESRAQCLALKTTLTSLSCAVIRRQPTMVSIASLSEDHAEKASLVFHQPWFRWFV